MKKVGILGGMGPDATVLLMQKIIAGIEADDDNSHIPLVVHQNTQVPSRIKRILKGNGDDPAPVLKQMALDLENMNCDFLAMPCNTAHYYYQYICKGIRVPFLNMIELSAKKLAKLKLSRIGIMASPAVKKIGVFDQSFQRYNLTKKFPDNDARMLKIIKTVKNGSLTRTTIENFEDQILKLIDCNCDGILIACTELSLLRGYVPKSLACVDSLDCLAESIIREATIQTPTTAELL